jgi:hypothetical protein
MPRCQEDTYLAIAHSLPSIVKQLKIANRLKALELKAKSLDGPFKSYITPEMVDDILEDRD